MIGALGAEARQISRLWNAAGFYGAPRSSTVSAEPVARTGK